MTCMLHRPELYHLHNRGGWCKLWHLFCTETKALVVSRSRTVRPPHGDLILSGVSFRASPTLDILGVKFDSKLTLKSMCVVLFPVSLRELVFWGWWNVYLWTPLCFFVAIRICSPNPSVLFSGAGVSCWMSPSASWAPGVFGGPDKSFFLCHRRRVAGQGCTRLIRTRLTRLYKVKSNSNYFLFSELPSASTRVRHSGVFIQYWSLN